MKILEISFIPPDLCSGGGMGVFQSIFSLAKNAHVDYIGPEFDRKIFGDQSKRINIFSILKVKNCSIVKKICRLLISKISTSYYDSWRETLKSINWSLYDAVHVECSRYNFVMKACRRHNKKVIVRVHNVERDYGYNLMKRSKSLMDYFRFFSFAANEKKVLKNSDMLVFLTAQDKERAKKLYAINCENSIINPVCLLSANNLYSSKKSDKEFNILLTGSLDYAPNINGIKWFLNYVWVEIGSMEKFKNVSLTVAGRNPPKSFKSFISDYQRVTLVDSPKDISNYFNDADIYVAPIFYGAGMKVKIAEALSYGLPIVGTSHAFIGYENIKKGLHLANTKEEYVKIITKFVDNSMTNSDRQQIFQEFKNKLSMDSSCERYKELIEKITMS